MPLIKLDKVPQRTLIPGYHVKFVHSGNMTFAYWDIEAGSPLPEHSHPHEQVTHMLDGKFEITVDTETFVLEPGSVMVIPGNAKHSGKALTNCRILDVFYPIRKDYR